MLLCLFTALMAFVPHDYDACAMDFGSVTLHRASNCLRRIYSTTINLIPGQLINLRCKYAITQTLGKVKNTTKKLEENEENSKVR